VSGSSWRSSSETLITVAPTGAEVNLASVPNLPATPEAMAETARQCEEAGASVIHVHVRDDAGSPTLDLVRLREVFDAVRNASGLIVQVSTGGAVTDPEKARLAVLDAVPEMASLSCGTVNFGDDIFVNRWPFMVELFRAMRDRRIVPEFEVFDLGHVENLRRLLDSEGEPWGGHIHVDLVMGVPGGMAGTTETLVDVVRRLPEGATFSATGIGRATIPVMLASLSAGGHLRVGMEDTLSLVSGERVRDNAQLVDRAADLAHRALRPPMAIAAARDLLGVRAPTNMSRVTKSAPAKSGRE
jgi:3-keto-5-aminohexanoate cleavage enzyme